MAKIDDKQAAAAFGTVIGLWIANIKIAVIAVVVALLVGLFATAIAFWVIWVSAYVALLVLHRISVMKRLWKIMSDELYSIK